MTPAKRLQEVTEEFAKGGIFEAEIIDPERHVEGLCDYDTAQITINPKVSVVDTLIHELLHRRYPKWTERRVRQETRLLMGILSHADVASLYQRYKRAVRKRRPVSST